MIDDGGPAFPAVTKDPQFQVEAFHPGMSLRDHFAAAEQTVPEQFGFALVSMPGDPRPKHEQIAEALADWRYLCADAMLKKRKEVIVDAHADAG